jgi:drug/metabolite transporter (DMT)-like permease
LVYSLGLVCSRKTRCVAGDVIPLPASGRVFHLVFPLFSSFAFVIGITLAKQAIGKGASPWTAVFLGNVWLFLLCSASAILRGEVVPSAAWGQAALVGGLFVMGQVFTYLAFQRGDVSVATPVLGLKVLIVALLTSMLAGEVVANRIWLAAALASVGIGLVQASGGNTESRNRWLTIALASLAALALSLFDVQLGMVRETWKGSEFLPIAFLAALILSCGLLPWVDRPRRLKELGAMRWMLAGTFLMGLQSLSISYGLATYGDAARMNIVYALRGLWGVVLAWLLAGWLKTNEGSLPTKVMVIRLVGAIVLVSAVVVALV